MTIALDPPRRAPRRRSLRMLLLGPLLALCATCILALPANAATTPATPDTASAAGWHYTSYEYSLCAGNKVYEGSASSHPAHCALWHITVSGEVAYNGSQAWTQWINCSAGQGKGSTISVSWCGTWNNGAEGYPYYLDLGANGYARIPGWGHSVWLRIDVRPNGSSRARGGS